MCIPLCTWKVKMWQYQHMTEYMIQATNRDSAIIQAGIRHGTLPIVTWLDSRRFDPVSMVRIELIEPEELIC